MWAKKIAIILITLLASSIGAQAKIYVVSAGVSDYADDEKDLLHPAECANAVAWLYNKNYGADYLLLTNQNATRENILNGIKQKFAKAKPEDTVIFFYSGHGYKGGIGPYDDMVSYKEIRKAMAKCKSKNKILFIDACHTGSARTPDKGDFDVTKDESGNVLLFLSSRQKETSLDSGTLKYTVFTNYLLEALKGKGDLDKDRIVTAKELYNYVSQRIKAAGFEQNPVMWGNFPDDMPIVVL